MGNRGSRSRKSKEAEKKAGGRASQSGPKENPGKTEAGSTRPEKTPPAPTTAPEVVIKPKVEAPDPNPGKTPLERLLWKCKLSEFYQPLAKLGYDGKDLRKLETLAQNKSKFEDVCKKAGMKLGHIRKFHHAVVDPSFP